MRLRDPGFVAECVTLQPEQEVQALAMARSLVAEGKPAITASLTVMWKVYGLHSVNAESLGGKYRQIWKRILGALDVKP